MNRKNLGFLLSSFTCTVALTACGGITDTPENSKVEFSENLIQSEVSGKTNIRPSRPDAKNVIDAARNLGSRAETTVLSSQQVADVSAAYNLSKPQLQEMSRKVDDLLRSKRNASDIKNYKDSVLEIVKKGGDQVSAQDDKYGAISFDEKTACVSVGLISCASARVDSYIAVNYVTQLFDWQSYGDGNEGNAFQHAFWNTLMTLTDGSDVANTIATAHETGHFVSVDWPHGYGTIWSNMDLFNNDVGRQYGNFLMFSNYSTPQLADYIYNVDKNGELGMISRDGQQFWWSNSYAPWPK